MKLPFAVAIAGLGIAGGALAVLLARAGHRVAVFERAPQPGPAGAGFLLQPSGQQVLQDMGLLPAIEDRSQRLDGLEAWTHRGHRLSDLKIPRVIPGGCSLGVHRGVIFEVLRRAAVEAGAEIFPGTEIVGVRESAAAIHPVDRSGRETGAFDLLAACDGARSALRAVLNPGPAATRPAAWGALWGTGPSALTSHVHQVTRGTRRLAGLLPTGGGMATFFWGLHHEELAPLRARGFPAFVEEVSMLFPQAAETLCGTGGFDGLTWATWHHLLPRRLHRGRLVLLGDAAHAMNPQLGQGANLALLDAAALARHLPDIPGYLRERRAPGRFYARLSAALSPFFQSRLPLAGLLRDAGLPLLQSIPWFRRQMELTFAGAKAGWLHRVLG